MAPANANVVIFEDYPVWQEALSRWLKEAGHNVVASAATMEEARTLVNNLPEETHVAIVDGNLTQGQDSCQEGNEIIAAIQQKAPEIKIIGFSTTEGLIGTDILINKKKVKDGEIGSTVERL